MVIPDFAGELPMTVEIAVIAWSAKSAVHVGDPCPVGRSMSPPNAHRRASNGFSISSSSAACA